LFSHISVMWTALVVVNVAILSCLAHRNLPTIQLCRWLTFLDFCWHQWIN